MATAVSMKDKTCVVTGATSGVGLETARALAERGARVLIVSRSAEKCKSTIKALQESTGNAALEFVAADLSVQSEVDRAADEIISRISGLDVLVNNAGAMFNKRIETADGLEKTFALNHMAYFIVTNRLLDLLKKSAPARIVNVASTAHKMVKCLDFRDLQSTKNYRAFRVYSLSKLANVLFTKELAERLAGSGVTANCLHPGLVATNFGANLPAPARVFFSLFGLKSSDGAKTSIYLATSPDVANVTGKYFEKSKESKPSPAALDTAAAKRLWAESEALSGRAENLAPKSLPQALGPALSKPRSFIHSAKRSGQDAVGFSFFRIPNPCPPEL